MGKTNQIYGVITPGGAGRTDANIISREVTVRTETIYNLLSANSL